MLALRVACSALWRSRLLAWGAGVGTVLLFGYGPVRTAFDPPGVTRGFGKLGDLLAAPLARWDSAWYLVIAHYGYRPDLGTFTAPRTAFFPLYPLGIRALAWLGTPPIVAGVLISLGAFAAALYGIHRLTTLELGLRGYSLGRAQEAAALTVMLCAFAPMAFFFSAVYSESLYLALSVGVFWCARAGRWRSAGLLGGLAAGTRSTGLVLLVPALLIYLYGPRGDRPAVAARAGIARLRPVHRPRAEVLWLALIPIGAVLFGLALWISGGDGLAPLHAQALWGRHLVAPFAGVWEGARAAFDGARQLLSGQSRHVYFGAASGSPSVAASHNLTLFAFLVAAVLALVGVFRRLGAVYGLYVLAALALPLSEPVAAQPLMSLPRFLVVLFPLSIAIAAWLTEHPRARAPVLISSGLLMVVFVAQFSTWHWVA